MKTVKKFLVFSLFMAAGVIFAGCGDTAKTGETATDEAKDKSTEAASEGSTSATTEVGDFQLVSLKVPNMT